MARKDGRFWIIGGLLLIAAALLLSAFNLWDTYRAGLISGSVLGRLDALIETDPVPQEGRPIYLNPDSLIPDEIEYPDYVLNPGKDMPVIDIDGLSCVCTIYIPSLEIALPVLNYWSYDSLNIAPCRYNGTIYNRDLVLCAHNYDTHFGQIKNLVAGDTIRLKDMDGNVFNYTVREIEILQPNMIDEMTASGYDLTLFTCTLGGQTRVTVRCDLVEET